MTLALFQRPPFKLSLHETLMLDGDLIFHFSIIDLINTAARRLCTQIAKSGI